MSVTSKAGGTILTFWLDRMTLMVVMTIALLYVVSAMAAVERMEEHHPPLAFYLRGAQEQKFINEVCSFILNRTGSVVVVACRGKNVLVNEKPWQLCG